MVSDIITVSSRDNQIDAVLALTEKVAAYQDLPAKTALHVRLLAEEMMGMLRAITGELEGKFWIDDADGMLRLHFKAHTSMDARQRSQLLSTATSGQNEADRGLMGKIRSFFEPVESVPIFFDMAPGVMYAEMSWSMRAYQDEVARSVQQKSEHAAEAWDELERSLIAHLADEVKVNIRGRDAELIVYKKLP